jgi:hypothetical protein
MEALDPKISAAIEQLTASGVDGSASLDRG